MKTVMKAALLLSVSLIFTQASLAGKPDRNPSEKYCPNVDLDTACSAELDYAYNLIGGLIGNNEDVPTFLSRNNPERDAATLQCKTSGAEIKLSQDKAFEAWYLMEQSKEKVESLFAQSKLSQEGRDQLMGVFQDAQDCISYP